MHQAVPEELLHDLSIRGFDALFESAAIEPVDTSAGSNGASVSGGAGTGASGAGISGAGVSAAGANGIDTAGATTDDTTWTLRAASEKLGLSPNTIRKRIRTGELRANKVIGPNGPEWKIQPPFCVTASGADSLMDADSVHGLIGPDALGAGTVATNNFPTLEALLKIIETQAKQLEMATTQLAVSTEQVKAATRVIAYQQLQLEEKDSKVKLLTDSRQHEGWVKKLLHRFKRD